MRRRVWVFSIPGCLDNPTRLNSETRLMGSRPCIIGLNVRSHLDWKAPSVWVSCIRRVIGDIRAYPRCKQSFPDKQRASRQSKDMAKLGFGRSVRRNYSSGITLQMSVLLSSCGPLQRHLGVVLQRCPRQQALHPSSTPQWRLHRLRSSHRARRNLALHRHAHRSRRKVFWAVGLLVGHR